MSRDRDSTDPDARAARSVTALRKDYFSYVTAQAATGLGKRPWRNSAPRPGAVRGGRIAESVTRDQWIAMIHRSKAYRIATIPSIHSTHNSIYSARGSSLEVTRRVSLLVVNPYYILTYLILPTRTYNLSASSTPST